MAEQQHCKRPARRHLSSWLLAMLRLTWVVNPRLWMPCQVYVFIDDGPLPPSKGLMDVPGEDESPMRAVIRSEGFKQVDSLMMVLDKTFLAAGPVSSAVQSIICCVKCSAVNPYICCA